jgi:hypothetical protein
MENLPDDFKKNYYKNLIFRLKHYFSLTPLFTEDGKYIEIYKLTYSKKNLTTKFVFNKLTFTYEYNGKKFLKFNDLLEEFNMEFIQDKMHINRYNL